MKSITEKHRVQLKPVPAYATIIPARTTKPVVSLHNSLGHAKNAVQAQGFGYQSGRGYRVHEAEVYCLDYDGSWKLMWRIEEGTFADELPWAKR